ncbi:MAG: hypothetical protein FJY77_02245 [Candidatus Altiarchaeales archaeon]|nr:hypothetical protein [Candidatus Altiarchaeales archaeon]
MKKEQKPKVTSQDEQAIGKLNRWLGVYSTYEKTLKHFNHQRNIPVMRVLAVVELLGEEEKFKRNDPELMQQLVSQAGTLFPIDDERKAALTYLEARMKADEVKKVFPEGMYSDEERKRLLSIWSDRSHIRSHTLSDVCIDDRLESVHNVLDDLFHKRHFSPALQALESLNPEAQNPMQLLADSWRALNLALTQILGVDEKAAGKRQPKTDPKMQIEADRIKSEIAQMPKGEQIEELKRRQASVEEEQERLKAWGGVRSLGVKYEGKMDGLSERLASCREKLGEHAPLIESLGFRFDQSFRKKIYLGDVDMLSTAVEKNLQIKEMQEARRKELEVLRGILKDLKKASNDAEQYLGGLQPTLTESLSMLEAKRTRVQNLRSVIGEGDSFQDALKKVEDHDKRLAGFIQNRIRDEQTPEDARRVLLDKTLVEYEDSSAITDVRNILEAVKPQEESSGTVVHNYSHEIVFSKMLEALKGQCLDYRTSHNSIGNSVYNVSLMDPTRGLDISQDSDRRPRFDAITYLAPIEADGVQQPAIVTDPFYVPDGSVTSWSKIEGHLMYLMEKADKMGLPLVIPESHITANITPFEGMQAEENLTFEKKPVKVTLLPGATGETYCEMTGYVHYSSETTQEIQAYVYAPKPKSE